MRTSETLCVVEWGSSVACGVDLQRFAYRSPIVFPQQLSLRQHLKCALLLLLSCHAAVRPGRIDILLCDISTCVCSGPSSIHFVYTSLVVFTQWHRIDHEPVPCTCHCFTLLFFGIDVRNTTRFEFVIRCVFACRWHTRVGRRFQSCVWPLRKHI